MRKYNIVLFFTFILAASQWAVCSAGKNFVVFTSNGESWNIPDKISYAAQLFDPGLKFSSFFLVENILDSDKMRKWQLDQRVGKGKIEKVIADDGETIECTFHDRGSGKLLIVGTGYGNEREKVAPLIQIFDKYDVVTFDYPYQGKNKPKLLNLSQWSVNPPEKLRELLKLAAPSINWNRVSNIDLKKVSFGQNEAKYVEAVVKYFKEKKEKEKKRYKKVYGACFCFSCGPFTEAASKNPKLFDKLILDSAMCSAREIIDRITKRPQLLIDPQRGLWNAIMNDKSDELTEQIEECFDDPEVKSFLKNVMPKDLNQKTTADHLSKIQIPVLFFHGKQDIMTPYESDFSKNWSSVNSQKKVAIIFENSRHLTNHIKNKELYAAISTLFLDFPYSEFVTCLKNVQNFIQYKVNQIKIDVQFLTNPEISDVSEKGVEEKKVFYKNKKLESGQKARCSLNL
jgi:hypothetical protein